MTKIYFKEMSFTYEGQPHAVFENVSFQLDSRWKLGIVGRNGRGKTTLLRIFAGQLEATGQVYCPVEVGYFPVTILDQKQTGMEWLQTITGAQEWEIAVECSKIRLAEERMQQPLETLSGGEETKVQLIALFLANNEFMVIDEPTNHLDQSTREDVAQYLKQQKSGMILVSHDRVFLDRVIDHVLSIDKAQIELRKGNVQTYLAEKKRQDLFEQEQHQALEKEVRKLTKIAHEKRNWANNREQDIQGNPQIKGSGGSISKGFDSARAARMMKKALTVERRREKTLAETKTLLKNIEYTESLTLAYTPSRERELIRLTDFQLAYEKDRWLFQPLSQTIERGDRIALVGPNGSGKTSLLEALRGRFDGYLNGTIKKKSNLSLSYVRQRCPAPDLTLREIAEREQLALQTLYHFCQKLGLERAAFSQKIAQMSLGQQKKVELAQAFATPAELLIWDEPLNALDFINQEQILEVLAQVQPTLIFVEHDTYFREHVATKVLRLVTTVQ